MRNYARVSPSSIPSHFDTFSFSSNSIERERERKTERESEREGAKWKGEPDIAFFVA